MSDPKVIVPGVVYFRNDEEDGNQAHNLVIHFSADVDKRSLCYRPTGKGGRKCYHRVGRHREEGGCARCGCHAFLSWEDYASREYSGGKFGPKWGQEQNIDFDAETGLLTFWAYNADVNLVDPFPIPLEWPKWVAVDFGGTAAATAVVLLAENPRTLQRVVWGEVYARETGSAVIRRRVYELFAREYHLDLGSFKLEDLLEDGVGDPARPQDILDWADEPFSIPLHGNPRNSKGRGLSINARKAGIHRVNEWLEPSAYCHRCAKRTPLAPECFNCGTKQTPAPLLVFQRGRAPELERTLPLIKTAPKKADRQEGPDEPERGAEDHAPDALRYGCMTRPLEEATVPPADDILNVPGHRLGFNQLLDRVVAERVAQIQAEKRHLEEDADPDVVQGTDPLLEIEAELGLIYREEW